MKVYYCKDKKQLVYVGSLPTPDYWDSQWKSDYMSLEKLYKNYTYVSYMTKKYVPKNSTVLEGGCGRGNHVYALKQNGFKVIGIDYARNTVDFLNKFYPDLDVRMGDVRKLDIENDSVDAYWSLGVIEHFFDGYTDIADEMTRILRKKGYLFLTFPVMNGLRRLKVNLRMYDNFDNNKDNFYQYALNLKLVIKEFQDREYEIILLKRNNGFKGLKDESPRAFKRLLQKVYDSEMFINKLMGLILDKSLSFFCGHTILMVLRKM